MINEEKQRINFWVYKDLYLDFYIAVKRNCTNMTDIFRDFMKGYVDKNKEVTSP